MKKVLFPHDHYDTPENAPRALGNRLMMGSRWWFYHKFLKIVLRSRSYAVKGIYENNL